jgi:hypothetical protein
MFAIGTSEPIDSGARGLVRHSIVWLGPACGETARGLPATHPIGRLLLRILDEVRFVGTWLMCRDVSLMREFERKVLLLRLNGAEWTIDQDQTTTMRAQRAVSVDSPWPYRSTPALPWPQYEILVVGCNVGYAGLDCRSERNVRSQHPVRGDGLVLQSALASLLVAERGYAISVGRSQTENSPGLSLIGPDGWLDPESLVERAEIAGIHRGADAARAWSYGRVIQGS